MGIYLLAKKNPYRTARASAWEGALILLARGALHVVVPYRPHWTRLKV